MKFHYLYAGFCMLLFTLLSDLSAWARPISEREARAIAETKLPGLGTKMNRVRQKEEASEGANAPLYVFTSPTGGFAIVAGDDRMPNMVLAYSETGELDLDDCPPAMRAWMEETSQFIEAGNFEDVNRLSIDYTSPVSPLVTTKWDQNEPYNLMTPLGSKGRHCPTGCLATAMAQIVNYWKYPKEGGLAEHSYQWNGQTLSVDFRESRYDWENMADAYNQTSTDSQKYAVAKLMMDCGIACDMIYGDMGSGAYGFDAARGLVDYLGYNPGLRVRYRATMGDEDWFALVKGELDEYRPLLFTAATAKREGHAFVCDGYDESGLFHINWGWGGSSNGYFDLLTLNPKSQGTGGASSGQGFTEQQAIIEGLRPAESDDEAAYGWELEMDDFNVEIFDDDASLFQIFMKIGNYGYRPFEGDLVMHIEHDGHPEEVGKNVVAQLSGNYTLKSNMNVSISTNLLTAGDFEDGIYRLTFFGVGKDDTEEMEVHTTVLSPPMRFEIAEGKVFYDVRPRLAVSDIEVDEFGFYYTIDDIVRGQVANLTFTVTNNSDCRYMGGLRVDTRYVNGESSDFNTETTHLRDIPYIEAGESIELTVPIQYNVAGEVAVIIGPTGRTAETPQEAVLTENEFEFESDAVYHELELADQLTAVATPDETTIIANVRSCTGGVTIDCFPIADLTRAIEKDVTCEVFDAETNELVGTQTDTYYGAWNNTRLLVFHLDRPLGKGSYIARLTYKSVPDIFGRELDLTLGEEDEGYSPLSFTVAVETGLTRMGTGPSEDTGLYTPSGLYITDGRTLAPGLYLRRQGGKMTKIIIK